jgi:hypothetical protein
MAQHKIHCPFCHVVLTCTKKHKVMKCSDCGVMFDPSPFCAAQPKRRKEPLEEPRDTRPLPVPFMASYPARLLDYALSKVQWGSLSVGIV